MEFTEKDFSRCLHNPLSEDFFENSDRLQEISPDKRMMAYIIMVYDPKSPMRKEYSELPLRKQAAMELSGWTIPEDENTMIDVTESIVDYLKYVNNRLWSSIVAIESTIWEMIERLFRPIETVGAGEDKDKLAAVNMKTATSGHLVELNNVLDGLITKFCDHDEGVRESVSNKPMIFSSEAIAAAMKNKK